MVSLSEACSAADPRAQARPEGAGLSAGQGWLETGVVTCTQAWNYLLRENVA